MFSIAVFFSINSHALVLGDIQVSSTLGQPLRARIAVADLNETDAQQFKVRLANAEDYRKLGLQYPAGQTFRFDLVNEPNAPAYIGISSSRPLDELFVNLLIEVFQSQGKMVRAYTFLLDPPMNPSTVEIQQAKPPEASKSAEAATTNPVAATSDMPGKSARRVTQRHHAHHKNSHHQQTRRLGRPVQPDGQHMRLTMSLSISSYDPSLPASANRDALEEELISKQKALQDLKEQIGAMEVAIRALGEKETQDAQADVAPASAVAGVASEVAGVASDTASEVPAAAPASSSQSSRELSMASSRAPVAASQSWLGLSRLDAMLALVAVLLAAVGLVVYRKRVLAPQQGMFDDLAQPREEQHFESVTIKTPVHVSASSEPVVLPVIEEITPSPAVGQQPEPAVATVGEQSMELPAYSAVVPPEYEMLMAAKRHTRAGEDKLAEEALMRAIAINPNNAYGYQALLKIYEKRGDAAEFERVARQLKEAGDADAFMQAAEMGRRFDPENALYRSGNDG